MKSVSTKWMGCACLSEQGGGQGLRPFFVLLTTAPRFVLSRLAPSATAHCSPLRRKCRQLCWPVFRSARSAVRLLSGARTLRRSRCACSRRPASLRLGLETAALRLGFSPSLRSSRAAHNGSALLTYCYHHRLLRSRRPPRCRHRHWCCRRQLRQPRRPCQGRPGRRSGCTASR